MPTSLRDLIGDLIDLVYPKTCAACVEAKPVRGGIFCISCLAQLPETDFHKTEGNPFEMHFWGRVPIVAGAAFLFFVPGGRVQTLLHNIKYRQRSEFAYAIGELYGEKLKEVRRFQDIDLIVPVPLHRKKEWQRGFNQSAEFGRGLAEALSVEFRKDGLTRLRYTETQTRKSRTDRVANLRDAFAVTREETVKHKHILLVDDVLTTGATLEACALVLQCVEGVRISMVTIACGRM